MISLTRIIKTSLSRGLFLVPLGILGLACVGIYSRTSAPEFPNAGDNLWYIPAALSLIETGSTDVSRFAMALQEMPPWEVWLTDMERDTGARLVAVEHRRYNYFPVGTTLLSVPYLWLHTKVFPRNPDINVLRYSNMMAERLATRLAAGAVVLVGLLIFSLGYSRWQAIAGAVLFAFATPHFSAHARALWSHNAFVFVFCLALWLLVVQRGKFAHWAALPLAFTYIIRPDAAIGILILGCYMLVHHRAQLATFIGLGLLVAVAFVVHSFSVYGTHLPPYYLASRLDPGSFWNALPGQLFSPSRGLLVFAPIFMFSFGGIIRVARKPSDFHPLFLYISLIVLLYLPLLACFPHWWGGHSYGPRLFSPIVPLLLLLIFPMLNAGGHRMRVAWAMVLVLTSLWSLFVQIRGVSNEAVHRWNAQHPNVDLYPMKIWDWNNWQIMATDDAPGTGPEKIEAEF